MCVVRTYLWTFANGAMIWYANTIGRNSALWAWRLAFEIFTHLLIAAFDIWIAFVTTSTQWIADVCAQTWTRWRTVDYFAFCVLTARARVTQFLYTSHTHERMCRIELKMKKEGIVRLVLEIEYVQRNIGTLDDRTVIKSQQLASTMNDFAHFKMICINCGGQHVCDERRRTEYGRSQTQDSLLPISPSSWYVVDLF